jgi:ketosteroid isomerase-like protein
MSGLSDQQARAALESVQAEWNRAMATWDSKAVARVYDREAQMFGSLAPLFTGPEGVEKYFSSFATAQTCEARFDNRDVLCPHADIIIASGFVTFAMRIAGDARVAESRFTLVLRRSDRWYILAHHISPVPTSSPAN